MVPNIVDLKLKIPISFYKNCDLLDKAIEDGLKESTMVAFKRLLLNTPIDTGNLRRSWSIQKQVKSMNGFVCIYEQSIQNDIQKAPYGPSVEYGHYVPSSKGIQAYKNNRFIKGAHMTKKTKYEMEHGVFQSIINKHLNLFLKNRN